MSWKKQSARLREVLGLNGHPVAVTYSIEATLHDEPPKYWVCEVLHSASIGKEIRLTAQSCACKSGAWQLGLIPPPEGEEYKALARFLVEGEKLCDSYASIYRMNRLITKPPYGLGDTITFSPLEKSIKQPDAVIFIVNPEQASRLIALTSFHTGIPPRPEIYGPTCHQVIGYTVVTGEVNISVMDITTRKRYKPDEMFVTIPGFLLNSIVDALEKSTAGVAIFEVPKNFMRTAFYTQADAEIAKLGSRKKKRPEGKR